MISILNLHFSYDRKRKLFEGIDLTIEAGKIYGLLGKNEQENRHCSNLYLEFYFLHLVASGLTNTTL